MDSGNRTKVMVPKGLDVFPHNTLWMVLTLTSLILSFVGIIILIIIYENKSVYSKMNLFLFKNPKINDEIFNVTIKMPLNF